MCVCVLQPFHLAAMLGAGDPSWTMAAGPEMVRRILQRMQPTAW